MCENEKRWKDSGDISTGSRVRLTLEEILTNQELQHAVPQELQPLIVLLDQLRVLVPSSTGADRRLQKLPVPKTHT